MSDVKPWPLVSSVKNASYRIFSLRTDRAVSPRTGQEHTFYAIEAAPWVNVIPLTPDRQVVMVRQYRHGTREVTWEIPGGLAEPEDTPESAARRELREETGFDGEIFEDLGWVYPNPAVQNNACHTFLARDVVLSGRQEQDEKEDIEVVLVPLTEIPGMIMGGTISHALVVAAFYKLRLLANL